MARSKNPAQGQRVVEPPATQVARAVEAVDDAADRKDAERSRGAGAGSAAEGGAGGRLKRLVAWWQRTRVARGLARYGAANGALLAGGIAYSALFSIFAALAIGVTAFLATLGGNAALRDAVFSGIDQALPGVLSTTPGDGGLVTPEDLTARLSGGVGVVGVVTTIVAAVVLLNSATAVIAAIRSSIRAIFGVVMPNESFVAAKLRDVAAFLVLAAAVVLTAALGIAVGAAGSAVTSAIGLDENPAAAVVLRVLGFAVALAVDTAVVMFLIRGLGGVRPPRRDLLVGALVTAIGAGVIRFLGTTAVGGAATSNPLVGGFVAIITLLLWVNLVVRVLLMVASWTANPPFVEPVGAEQVTHTEGKPNYVTETDPDTLAWDHDPQTGRIRPADPQREDYWGGAIGWVRRKYRGFRDA